MSCEIEIGVDPKKDMTRIAAVFSHSERGAFSHFAHLICDFSLPLFSLLKARDLLDQLYEGGGVILELQDTPKTGFGPLSLLVEQIFPHLEIRYVTQFTHKPVRIRRDDWDNNPEDIDEFCCYLRRVLPLRPREYGVIVVERGFNRKRYAGDTHLHRSGADRRRIGEGFQDLVAAIQEKRPDVLPVVLEDLSFTEQVSLFLNADTLIGQHGAAFVHAHWMPKGSHLVELQCCRPRLCPAFVPTIARLRGHRLSVVSYPCRGARRDLTMIVDDASKVSRLVEERR